MKKSKNPLSLGLSRKGKKFISTNPRLLTISENERQLLLNDRVANILENAHKFEDHNVYLTDVKIDFSDIPRRLQRFRDEACSLWNKAALPFEPDEESAFLTKLNASNRSKQCVTRLPLISPPACKKEEQTFAEKGETCSTSRMFCSESQNEESLDLFEKSDPEDEERTTGSDVEVTSQSKSQTEKKLFPIFSLSQKRKKSDDHSTTGISSCSIMSNISNDFETPKVNKSNPLIPKRLSCEVQSSAWKPPPLSASDHKDLAQDLLALFLEKVDADITLYGREEKPIKAHKLILKARCPKLLKDIVFENSKSRKEVIPLTCYSHTAVKSLMSYIYCGRILPPGFKIEDLRDRDLDEIKELGIHYGLDLTPQEDPKILTTTASKEADTQTDLESGEDKAVQTECLEDLEFNMEEERLNSVRLDERSREYRCDSYLHEGSFGHVFHKSPDLFEESFNDKVFAHSFERSTARKRRRTWSENKRVSVTDSDDDSIILLDDNPNGVDGGRASAISSDDYVASKDEEDVKEHKIVKKADDAAPSPWSKTYDDAFFANLPADDELLNMPPTSPIGTKTYNSPPSASPIYQSYQSPLTRKPPMRKEPAKRRPAPKNAKPGGEKRVKANRAKVRSTSPVDNSDDSDSEAGNCGSIAQRTPERTEALRAKTLAEIQGEDPVEAHLH